MSEIDSDQTVEFHLKSDRQAYLLCIEGEINISDQETLHERDAIELKGDLQLKFKTTSKAHILMVEMKKA